LGPQSRITFTVVFDNRPFRAGLESSWGYSCLIRGTQKTILFDTGADGRILLGNMKRLGISASMVDIVFISHKHWDHAGGLKRVLDMNGSVPVFVPASCPDDFKCGIRDEGATVISVDRPQALCSRVWSCGQMGNRLTEQSLVIDTDYGSVVLTGCAHPGIVEIVEKIHRIGQSDIALLMGGFHLRDSTQGEVLKIIRHLRRMWVLRVAPSHCTGEDAIATFRKEYGPDFIETGVGSTITV
jgi:7,8-dihydropterin-6-yl-methyl-4-(beta-D-ribofuranosyl)aminobenzene 5'-phosphate synthase